MRIRLAAPADIESLVAFNASMALETEGKILDREVLRRGVGSVFSDEHKGFYVVAEKDSRIVGGLMVTYEWSDWRAAWFWWIQSVYIVPKWRGRGIYGLMYEFVKARADEKGGVCGFRLYVENENVIAQAVYEKAGMSRSGYLMYEEEINK